MNRPALVLVLVLAAGLCWPAVAALADAGRIVEVTVYPDRAEIRRVIETRVEAGEHSHSITGLPARLDSDSLRVRASGPGGLVLGAVDTRVVRGSERVDERARRLESRIEALRHEARAIEYDIEALDLQVELLRSLAGHRGEREIGLGDWGQAIDALGTTAGEVLRNRHEAESGLQALEREIERLRRELADLGQAQRDALDAVIGYRSEQAGTARFTVEYVVPNVSWEPRYEVRLDTATPTLELTQRAAIRQDTGEDWSGVALRVSTSRPALGGQLPELRPWYIDIRQPRPVEMRDAITAAEPARLAAEEDFAMIDGSEFGIHYRVAGVVTVPSDNAPHTFALARHDLSPEVGVRAAPRLQPLAYLHAAADYTGDAPLLPGRATLYQDGILAGRTQLDRIVPGEPLALSFGVDERVEISYRLQTDSRGSEGVIRKRNHQQREYLIEVTNRHQRPVEITIHDQLPVARDERIVVEMTEDSDEPSARDLDDRPGVVAWSHVYGPDDTRRIRFGYRATYPADLDGLSGW